MADEKSRGKFVWYDLMTTDPGKAAEFYTKVARWGTTVWPGPQPYTMWTAGETPIGGVMQLPPGAGAPPHWLAVHRYSRCGPYGHPGAVARGQGDGGTEGYSNRRAICRPGGSAGRDVRRIHTGSKRRRA